jgi:hypothetical protein
MTKLRRMRWVGHVAHMGRMKHAYKMLSRKHECERTLEDIGVDERIILR